MIAGEYGESGAKASCQRRWHGGHPFFASETSGREEYKSPTRQAALADVEGFDDCDPALSSASGAGASLGRLSAGPGTKAIYVLVTLAAILRVFSPLAGESAMPVLTTAAVAWTAAFGLFAMLYGGPLMQPRASEAARPI